MSNIQTMHQDSPVQQTIPSECLPDDAHGQLAEYDRRLERVLSRKRARAIRYLELTRRFGGDAYNRNEPRVFTMQFVSELEQENALRRASRNPWLERMLQPVASDGADHAATNRRSVLPFGPRIAPADTSAPTI